jgi:hypothetical protein
VMQIITKYRDCQFFQKQTTSMQILFDVSISPGLSQSGELTSWAFYPGHQEASNPYSSLLTHSPNGWKLCQ